MPATRPRPLIVFADDWGRHPSSCQHLIRRLLPRRTVVWVNTIGTRPPRFDRATASRVFGKLRGWFGPKPSEPPVVSEPSPRVLAPIMWPSFRTRFGRGVNRRLLTRALRTVCAELPAEPIVVTTLPLVADLVGQFPAAGWVYYCVDDFSQWPGYDGTTLQKMERELVPKVDAAIAVSETLRNHLLNLGRPAELLTHGVDLPFWRTDSTEIPPELAGLEPPFVVFWGVIDGRTDVAFVEALARSMPRGTIVLFGPQEAAPTGLFTLPRVVVRSSVPFSRLPSIAASAGVLIMPYTDEPVTRAIQPLKFKEYLATGKPVVVRDLPATREWSNAADLTQTPQEFANAVLDRLTTGLPEPQRHARERLATEGWDTKAATFDAILERVASG